MVLFLYAEEDQMVWLESKTGENFFRASESREKLPVVIKAGYTFAFNQISCANELVQFHVVKKCGHHLGVELKIDTFFFYNQRTFQYLSMN